MARAAKKAGLAITLSSRICPEFREFERTSTTVVNAYVSPNMKTYLKRLQTGIRKRGGRRIRIIQSNGGSLSPEAAGDEAAQTLLSGPAAGVLGALSVCRQALKPTRTRPLKLITFDMGGTSTDVALIDGSYQITTESEISGWPVRVPMMDIHTVGAGGGSLAAVDAAGTLHVGPESAGADPGPCCYGKGTVPTVTDANLVIGRIEPNAFLGGRKTLHVDRAHRAMEKLARRLGTTRRETSAGILRVVNSSMERAIRVISVERGYDPRDFTLVTFGGAGGLHVCDLAEALSIPRVFVPRNPGVLSAWGAVSADVIKDYARTVMLPFNNRLASTIEAGFETLIARAVRDMKQEGFSRDALVMERSLDLRYAGQSFELNIPYSGSVRPAMNAFHRRHEQRYGHRSPGEPMDLVTLRLRAIGRLEKPVLEPVEKRRSKPAAPATGLIDRDGLKAGDRLSGPGILVEQYSTTWIPEGWQGVTDPWGHILLERA
ncbi:MAG: hydantoinase/oxoprolinase family protein [Verrucomicrobiota bacterium]